MEDNRREAFENFRETALEEFKSDLDSVLCGLEDKEEISLDIGITVNSDKRVLDDGEEDYRNYRHTSRELSLCNKKPEPVLKPVEE